MDPDIEWDGVFKPPREDPLPNFLGNVHKPNNGFWTSSERPDGGSSWLDVWASQNIEKSPVHFRSQLNVGGKMSKPVLLTPETPTIEPQLILYCPT